MIMSLDTKIGKEKKDSNRPLVYSSENVLSWKKEELGIHVNIWDVPINEIK